MAEHYRDMVGVVGSNPTGLTKHMKNKHYKQIAGKWVHRTPLKLIVNPILRKLQWRTDRPFVVASRTEWVDSKPQFRGYVFVRVEHVRR